MDKKFIKSMVAAVAGLGLISSCSSMGSKDSHKCAGKNSCKGKMMEDSHKCGGSTKKVEEKTTKKVVEENNNCGAKNGCAAAKTDAKPAAKKAPAKKSN